MMRAAGSQPASQVANRQQASSILAWYNQHAYNSQTLARVRRLDEVARRWHSRLGESRLEYLEQLVVLGIHATLATLYPPQ